MDTPKKRIKDTSKVARRIKIIGKRLPRVDPAEVAKALGAKKVEFSELPEYMKLAAGSPFLHRSRTSSL